MSRASLPKVDGEEALRRDSHTSRSQEAPLRIIDVEVAEAAPAARRVAAGPRLHTGTPGLRARARAPRCSPGRARLLPARAAASSLQAAFPPVPLPLRSFRNRHLQRSWVVRLKVDELRWHYVSSADLAHQAYLQTHRYPRASGSNHKGMARLLYLCIPSTRLLTNASIRECLLAMRHSRDSLRCSGR